MVSASFDNLDFVPGSWSNKRGKIFWHYALHEKTQDLAGRAFEKFYGEENKNPITSQVENLLDEHYNETFK
jgi:hypothetical protein